MMKQKRIRYSEGQWFAVPLRTGGYAVGTIVRGSYKTKGGLGYFFGPRYAVIPDEESTWEKKPGEAVLITRFGDIGIINGSWPLIKSTRLFSREEWPIPKFGLEVSLLPGKGFIRDYTLNDDGKWELIKETLTDVKDIVDLPQDSSLGGGAVEILLTKILSNA